MMDRVLLTPRDPRRSQGRPSLHSSPNIPGQGTPKGSLSRERDEERTPDASKQPAISVHLRVPHFHTICIGVGPKAQATTPRAPGKPSWFQGEVHPPLTQTQESRTPFRAWVGGKEFSDRAGTALEPKLAQMHYSSEFHIIKDPSFKLPTPHQRVQGSYI